MMQGNLFYRLFALLSLCRAMDEVLHFPFPFLSLQMLEFKGFGPPKAGLEMQA